MCPRFTRFRLTVFIINLFLTPLVFILILWFSLRLGVTPTTLIFILLVSLIIDYPRLIAKVVLLPVAEHLRKPNILKNPVYVSVIIPAHNEEKTISKCIESVLENKYMWKQVIVVDDGSQTAPTRLRHATETRYCF